MPTETTTAQVTLNRVTPSHCRVVLDNPPLNLMGPEFVLQIREIVTALERLVNEASLPPDVEIRAGWDACMASVKRPAAQERIKALLEQGLQEPGDSENRLGFCVGQLRLGEDLQRNRNAH